MASIPQELVDMIIDELRDHRGSLQACALTSGAFYPRASALLFEGIRFQASRKRFDAFRDLCHQNPRLASLVKSLHIIYRRENTGRWLSETLRNVSALTPEHMRLAGCTVATPIFRPTVHASIDPRQAPPRIPGPRAFQEHSPTQLSRSAKHITA